MGVDWLGATPTTPRIFQGETTLNDLANLRGDLTEEFRATGYGKGVKARDFGKLKMFSTVLIGLTALAILH